MSKQGNLSINSDNIFPIIKKWLYSDHDIFYRELVSNGCDAITKLKKLDIAGEYTLPEDYKPKVNVSVSANNKTITITDNGLGMTSDEVEEYITQIAFSGATQFLEKYKDKTNEDQIIGHFGLGFYSAFMVAREVHIDTLSFKDGAKPVHWECDGGTTYTIDDGDKDEVGTTITLFLNEDALEFANIYRAKEILDKYCSFMPVEIFLDNEDSEPETEIIDEKDLLETDRIIERIHTDAKFEEKDGEKKEISPEKDEVKIEKRPVSISDTNPLWTKHPNDCEKDEYIAFYRKVFNDYKEPLFWIHLNMDYPFNLKGILYFPRINTQYDSIEGTIKLYNNQVFIADNIKEVIPEFLMLLKGVIDCPDLPLNVSRSALQNDGFVKKISDYIAKKVADKLSGMCKTDRENYEGYWDSIAPFIKYGCLKDEKFCEKMSDYMLFKTINDEYITIPDYIKAQEERCKDDEEANKNADSNADEAKENGSDEAADVKKTTIYYVTDARQQSQYINLFKDKNIDAVLMTENIDSPFINHLEQKNETIAFKRIDTALQDEFTEEISEEEKQEFEKDGEKVSDIVKKALENESLNVTFEKFSDDNTAAMITLSEESNRMAEMMKMYGMDNMDMNMFGQNATLMLNANHPLVKFILEHKKSQKVPTICKQLYDLAMLAHRPLSPEEMTEFIKRSQEIMVDYTK